MTAKSFEHLLDQWPALGPRATQEHAALRLPGVVRAAGVSVWHPNSEPRPRSALVLGVASWSRLDLRFLDELLAKGVPERRLVVFDLKDLAVEGSLQAVFPELTHRPDQTPLLVVLREGAVEEAIWGAAARNRVLELASDAGGVYRRSDGGRFERSGGDRRDAAGLAKANPNYGLRSPSYRRGPKMHIGVGESAIGPPAKHSEPRIPSVA